MDERIVFLIWVEVINRICFVMFLLVWIVLISICGFVCYVCEFWLDGGMVFRWVIGFRRGRFRWKGVYLYNVVLLKFEVKRFEIFCKVLLLMILKSLLLIWCFIWFFWFFKVSICLIFLLLLRMRRCCFLIVRLNVLVILFGSLFFINWE